jgi:hypothetical protein
MHGMANFWRRGQYGWIIFSRTLRLKKKEVPDFASRIYGDFAIITSKGDWIGTFDGKYFNQKCIVVDTWHMRDGRWRVGTRTSDCTDQ